MSETGASLKVHSGSCSGLLVCGFVPQSGKG